jgi:hypothetical protein
MMKKKLIPNLDLVGFKEKCSRKNIWSLSFYSYLSNHFYNAKLEGCEVLLEQKMC